MFETVIGYILNKVLGEFIDGIDMNNLNIGMLSKQTKLIKKSNFIKHT